jgi:hypothetical protein
MKSDGSGIRWEVPEGMAELTPEEEKRITAGDSIVYWLGYTAGKIAQFFS